MEVERLAWKRHSFAHVESLNFGAAVEVTRNHREGRRGLMVVLTPAGTVASSESRRTMRSKSSRNRCLGISGRESPEKGLTLGRRDQYPPLRV